MISTFKIIFCKYDISSHSMTGIRPIMTELTRCQPSAQCCDVTWTSWRLKLPKTMFVQQLLRANNKQNTKVPHNWPSARGMLPFTKGQKCWKCFHVMSWPRGIFISGYTHLQLPISHNVPGYRPDYVPTSPLFAAGPNVVLHTDFRGPSHGAQAAAAQNPVGRRNHYDDVIMTMLASQITSLTVVYSIVYSGVNQRKHQSSASLAFVREIHRGPVNFPHKWPVTRKMFPFDDVIMIPKLIFKLDLNQAGTSYQNFLYLSFLNKEQIQWNPSVKATQDDGLSKRGGVSWGAK